MNSSACSIPSDKVNANPNLSQPATNNQDDPKTTTTCNKREASEEGNDDSSFEDLLKMASAGLKQAGPKWTKSRRARKCSGAEVQVVEQQI